MDVFHSKMDQGIFFFARARAHARSIFTLICLVFSAFPTFAQENSLLIGFDHRAHGLAIDHSQEDATRKKLQISDDCALARKQATALALIGSEGATVTPRLQSHSGIVVLEGLRKNAAQPKVLDTRLLGPYKNYPTSIPGEISMQPAPRYPLAITFAANLPGQSDLQIRKGDALTIQADHQLYTYALPVFSIPSGGVLRLYVGTDDQLYFDSELKHPLHTGRCKKRA